MKQNLVPVLRAGWRFAVTLGALLGILYIPNDIRGLPEALGIPAGALRTALEAVLSISRESLLTILAALMSVWILWIDVRPSVIRWLQRRRAPPFSVRNQIYEECFYIKGIEGIYLHRYYVVVGNNLEDGQKISKAQARILHFGTPYICAVKGHESGEIDIRHGEWAFFEIGRMATKELGPTFGPTEVEPDFAKMYEHNVTRDFLSFEFWSYPNKREALIAGGSPDGSAGSKGTWRFPLVLSADGLKSESLCIVIDFSGTHPAIRCERTSPGGPHFVRDEAPLIIASDAS